MKFFDYYCLLLIFLIFCESLLPPINNGLFWVVEWKGGWAGHLVRIGLSLIGWFTCIIITVYIIIRIIECRDRKFQRLNWFAKEG